MITLVAVIGIWLVVASPTTANLAKCPNIEPENKPFDIPNLMGTWYELRSTDNWWFKTTHKCTEVKFEFDDDNVLFTRTSINKAWFWTKSVDSGLVTFDLKLPWALTYSWKSWGMSHTEGPYHILKTDYQNFMVLWKCENHWYRDFTTQAYVLGRSRDMDLKKYEKEIGEGLMKVKESMSNYYEDNQSGCK